MVCCVLLLIGCSSKKTRKDARRLDSLNAAIREYELKEQQAREKFWHDVENYFFGMPDTEAIH